MKSPVDRGVQLGSKVNRVKTFKNERCLVTSSEPQTLPAGCLGGSTPLRCRCWVGRCRPRWTWWGGWTERLSSENNHTNRQTHGNCESFQTPWKQRTKRTDGWFMHQRFSLFAVASARAVVFPRVDCSELTHVHVTPELPSEDMNEPLCWGAS